MAQPEGSERSALGDGHSLVEIVTILQESFESSTFAFPPFSGGYIVSIIASYTIKTHSSTLDPLLFLGPLKVQS